MHKKIGPVAICIVAFATNVAAQQTSTVSDGNLSTSIYAGASSDGLWFGDYTVANFGVKWSSPHLDFLNASSWGADSDTWTGYTPILSLSAANNFVGIGTTNPQTQLHVAALATDSIQRSEILQNPNNSGDANAGVGIQFKTSSYSSGPEITKWAGITSAIDIGTQWGDYTGLAFYTYSGPGVTPTEKVRVTSAGNVGIGTTSPRLQPRCSRGNTHANGGLLPRQQYSTDYSMDRRSLRWGLRGGGRSGWRQEAV